MKLGVFINMQCDNTWEEAAEYWAGQGVQCVEIGAGGYSGPALLHGEAPPACERRREEMTHALRQADLSISALRCCGNPLHPQKSLADNFHLAFIDAVLLAEQLEVDTIVAYSGCPGDSPGSQYPNWVSCIWPEDFSEILEYQWNEELIPYWRKMAAFCGEHHIRKIAMDMRPGFCVYNPYTLLRLREAVGDIIGANLDPGHLYWQGIDPCAAVAELAGVIQHVHAKDLYINRRSCEVNGLLDTRPGSRSAERSWIFRTVGHGGSGMNWHAIVSALGTHGYEGAVSVDQEDGLLGREEGLKRSLFTLRHLIC